MRKISSSPHIHTPSSVSNIMLKVIIALMPATIWGIYAFGFRALVVLLVSIVSAVLVEYLLGKIDGKNTISDLTAVLTGLLVGMNMPSSIPLFIPVIASAFAIFVVKWSFGGLGANWMNPALGGRVFVFFSFTGAMSSYPLPKMLLTDTISSATPLSFVKTALGNGIIGGQNSLQILSSQNYPVTNFAQNIAEKTGISPYTIDSFFGNTGGCIGEISALLLIVGGIYLIISKVITFHIPVAYLGSFAIFSWIFGGIPFGLGAFSGEVFAPMFRGGLILGAFFMATDMVTTPITKKGMVIFGIGCGFLTFLFRNFGSLPEATSLAIILMNIVSPTIDRYVKPKLFGQIKEKKNGGND